MRTRYWLNRVGLVLLALPVVGILVPVVDGARHLRPPPPGVGFGLLMSASVWVAAWRSIQRREERARALARPAARPEERT